MRFLIVQASDASRSVARREVADTPRDADDVIRSTATHSNDLGPILYKTFRL